MKPFKINRNSWHYKLNRKFFNAYGDNEYYMHDSWEPRHNNFCAYWRATMFRVIFAIFLSVFVGLFFFVLGGAVYQHPIDFLISISSILGIIALGIIVVFCTNWLQKREKKEVPESLFMQKYKAHKSKICPMVEYD
jgi:hypothetical protein